MTVFIYIVIALVVFLVTAMLLAPREATVERETTISSGLEDVERHIRLLRYQSRWLPWIARDGSAVVSFAGDDDDQITIMRWQASNGGLSGTQTLMAVDPAQQSCRFDILFESPWRASGTSEFQVSQAENSGTRVKWSLLVQAPMPMNVLLLFFKSDIAAIGDDMARGLQDLALLVSETTKLSQAQANPPQSTGSASTD